MDYVHNQDIQNSISRFPAIDNKHHQATQSDASRQDIENSVNSTIKVEPEIDNFEYGAGNACNSYNITECIKEESKMSLLENTEGIEYYENFIVDDLIDVSDRDFNREEEFSNQEIAVKNETIEKINVIDQMPDTVYEEWKLKNEELDVKEENLGQNNTRILVSESKHTLCQQYHDQIRKRCHYQNIEKSKRKNPENVNMFKCSQCDYQTIRKVILKHHFLQHQNPRRVILFKCDRCDFKTTEKSYVKIHLLWHTNPEQVNMFQCDQCEFKTIHSRSLRKHHLLHINPGKVNFTRPRNPEEIKVYKCELCEFQTKQKSSFKQHIPRHINPEV